MTTTLMIGLLIPLLGTMLGSAFVFFMKNEMSLCDWSSDVCSSDLFISVPAKWIMTARQYVLNIYTENRAYARPFKTGFG